MRTARRPAATAAARWLGAFEALVGRAAHEVNGALNGVTVNLEVVRMKARAASAASDATGSGLAAAAALRFADVAAAELEGALALSAALLALARAPRAAPADVREVTRHVVALLAPAVAHQRVRLELDDPGEPLPTAADGYAVRLAVAAACLAACDAAAARGGAPGTGTAGTGTAGTGPAATGVPDRTDEPIRRLRCILASAPAPTLRLTPAVGARLPDDVVAALQGTGVRADTGDQSPDRSLALAFPGV